MVHGINVQRHAEEESLNDEEAVAIQLLITVETIVLDQQWREANATNNTVPSTVDLLNGPNSENAQCLAVEELRQECGRVPTLHHSTEVKHA